MTYLYHFAKWLPQIELGECTPIKLKEVIPILGKDGLYK